MIIQEKLDSVDVFVLKRILICWGCLLCCAITTVDVFVLLYLMLGVLFIVFSPKQYGILMYFSLVSFTNVVSVAPNYTISLNWILTIALICRCFFRKIVIYRKPAILFVLFTLYMISGLNPSQAGFLSDIKTIVNYFLLLIVACTVQKEYYKKLFDFYIVGHVLSLIFSIPAYFSPRFHFLLQESYIVTSVFESRRFTGIDFDTNFLAVNCAFIISILLFFLANSNDNKKASRIKIAILAYIMIGMLTLSKMFMIVLVVLILIYYGTNFSKKYVSMFFMSAVLLITFFVGNTLSNGMLFYRLFGRFIETSDNVNVFTTGRFNIWMTYIESWLSSSNNILFGVGMANKRLSLFKMHHSTYIEVLYQFGVIGTSLFLFFLFNVAKLFKSGMLVTKIHTKYIGLTSICVCGMALGLFAFDFFPLHLLLCFLMLGDIEWSKM